jgi:bifunctional pyridoxal-dependent enzyme with beta-cystathionase and maltose regulon repressor activities
MTPLNPELTELSLERLQRRRSAKWAKYPAEVLPAWVAEMDFPLAAPVKRALLEAVELGDCGYAHPEELGATFAEFAADRHGCEPSRFSRGLRKEDVPSSGKENLCECRHRRSTPTS